MAAGVFVMDSENKRGLIYFILGVVLALLIWGVQLIGVVVNIFLGGIVLATAFGLVVYAFWIWERASTWHVLLRIGTITAAATVYFLLVGRQMVAEWHKEHLTVATRSPEPIPPTSPARAPQEPPAKKSSPPKQNPPKGQQQSEKGNVQTGPITTGPCSNVFNGGSGNQGTTNCSDVPPQIVVTKQKENAPDNGVFTTEFRLDITASKAFSLHVKVSAPNLIGNLKIDDVRPPKQGGMAFQATSKYGVGFTEMNYSNIESGSYIVTVQTSKPNTVRLDCR
jgi:hypothetical protein